MTREDDNDSGDKHSGPILDSLSFEFALRSAKLYSALLPASHVPLVWLRELATADYPDLAVHHRAWDFIVRSLFANGILCKSGDTGAIPRADKSMAGDIRHSLDEWEADALRSRLRAFCSGRLEKNRSEEQRLINSVMTGDPNTEATAWTVPRVEEALARAVGDDRVDVVEFGDGTYSVRPKTIAPWEEASLKAFVAQEFAAEDLDGVEWALRTNLLTTDELKQGEARIGDRHLRNPEGSREASVAGLYWLSMAHKWYGEGGSCRTAWNLTGKAVDILQRFRDRQPNEPVVTALLAEVEWAHWTYDD